MKKIAKRRLPCEKVPKAPGISMKKIVKVKFRQQTTSTVAHRAPCVVREAPKQRFSGANLLDLDQKTSTLSKRPLDGLPLW